MYGRSSSVLENSKLSLKQWVYLAYFWSHDAARVNLYVISAYGGSSALFLRRVLTVLGGA